MFKTKIVENEEETEVKNEEVDSKLVDDMIAQKSKIRRINRATQEEGVSYLQSFLLPKKNEEMIYLSDYHVNSMHFIGRVAEEEVIEEAYLVTFRLGKKQRELLINLQECGRIKNITLVVSQVQAQNDEANAKKNENSSYNYFKDIKKLQEQNDWNIHLYNTHAKIYLLRTQNNFYALLSSGNLNGNPKNEFFILKNDEETYNFLKEFYERSVTNGEDDKRKKQAKKDLD